MLLKTAPTLVLLLILMMKTHQLLLLQKQNKRCKMTPQKLLSALKSKKEWTTWEKKLTKERDHRKTRICLKISMLNFKIRVSLNKQLKVQQKLTEHHWRLLSQMKIDQMIKLEIQMNYITLLIKVNMIETLIRCQSSTKIGKIIMIKETTTLVLPMLQDFKLIIFLFQMHGQESLQLINQNILMDQISNQQMLLLLLEVVFHWLTWLLILKSMQQDSSRICSKKVLSQLSRLWMVDLAEVILSLVLHQLRIKESA